MTVVHEEGFQSLMFTKVPKPAPEYVEIAKPVVAALRTSLTWLQERPERSVQGGPIIDRQGSTDDPHRMTGSKLYCFIGRLAQDYMPPEWDSEKSGDLYCWAEQFLAPVGGTELVGDLVQANDFYSDVDLRLNSLKKVVDRVEDRCVYGRGFMLATKEAPQ